MPGEQLNASPANMNGWESLVNYRPPASMKANKDATLGSAIENTGKRVATSTESFLGRWNMMQAQKKAEKTDTQTATLLDKSDKLTDDIDIAQNDFLEASDAKVAASEDYDNLSSQLAGQREELAQDRKNYNIGNYLKSQSEQIGTILKSEKSVVKSALNAFKAKIVAKIPHIEISIKTDEQIASANWQEQLHSNGVARSSAKERIESAKMTQAQFESAKVARAEAIAGLGHNKEAFRDGRNEISNLRKDIVDTRKELAYAKYEKRMATQALEDAEENFSALTKRQERLASKINSLRTEREKADSKIAEFQAKADRLEALSKFQQELGSKSPARMRANIEKQLADIQEKKNDKLEDMLFMKGVDSVDELDPKDAERVQKRLEPMNAAIATLEAQRDALNQYEDLRQNKTNRMLSNPTVKKNIGSAFRAIRNTAAALFL